MGGSSLPVIKVKFYHPFYKSGNNNKLAKVRKHTTPIALCKHLSKKYVQEHSIVLSLETLHLERNLEDHEKVVNYCLESREMPDEIKLYYRVNPKKYEYFTDPEKVFKRNLSFIPIAYRCTTNPRQIATHMDFKRTFATTNELPCLHGHMRLGREDRGLTVWDSKFFVLRDKILYLSDTRPSSQENAGDVTRMQVCVALEYYEIYLYVPSTVQVEDLYRFCLKRHNSYVKSTEDKHFRCETADQRTCWMTGLRYAKYTSEIRKSYNKYLELKPYKKFKLPDVSDRTLTALSIGREQQRMKNKMNPRAYFPKNPMKLEIAAKAPHVWGKFLVKNVTTRKDAVGLLKMHSPHKGSCLIRYSDCVQNLFVISYYAEEEEEHEHDLRIYKTDEDGEVSLIASKNRYYKIHRTSLIFHDLLHLVDFCQLNELGAGLFLRKFYTNTGEIVEACTPELVELREPPLDSAEKLI